ncbi:MAG: DUF1003 domain-containing protein [Planctomycetota bacterium]|nr:DUF1003 domain-containing protein [Planctomycetota bacterium]
MEAREPVECALCHRRVPFSETKPAELVRGPVAALMRRRHPEWDGSGFVCRADQDLFRGQYVEEVLADERGEISEVERSVVEALREQDVLSTEPPPDDARGLALGHRMADRIARFGGSWRFLAIFGAVLVAWMTVNSIGLVARPFDPYPFILLNLVLSCIAAVQAPVILMSQNRQSERDRERAWNDYRVNLKAELEVRLLSEKVDRLQMHQWQRLMEIQRIQTELIEELGRRGNGVREDREG